MVSIKYNITIVLPSKKKKIALKIKTRLSH